MSKLRIAVEWERSDARLPLLRKSWARIVVSVDDTPITRLIDTETGGYRDGVFGSAWPLASWIIANWWSLLSEGRRSANTSVRVAGPGQRAWFHRHNLMTAQEASALPDASIFRDADRLGCEWHADGQTRPARGIRFIETGSGWLGVDEAGEALAKFVDATLAQCASEKNDPEYVAVADDWAATRAISSEKLITAENAARMGLDPFDPDDLTPAIVASLDSLRPHQQLSVDLLEVVSGPELEASAQSVLRALAEVMPKGFRGHARAMAVVRGRTHGAAGAAYEAGYQRARQLRTDSSLGLTPLRTAEQLPVRKRQLRDPLASGVVGLLGCERDDFVLCLAPRSPRAERFALARSLFFLPGPADSFSGRLVTDALSWEQAASRAFAAELLAPAEALRAALPTVVDEAAIAKASDEFDVSEMVIRHQIANHQIAPLNDWPQ